MEADQGMEGSKAPAYPIASVNNALTVLLWFQSHDTMRVSEASRLLGVAQSTASRIIAMLHYRGFVSKDMRGNGYVAGPALLALGMAVVGRMDLWRVAEPYAEELARRTGETVHLGVLAGDHVVYVGGVESTKTLRVGLRVGLALPGHATSGGKVLLAELPTHEVRNLYGPELARRTTSTIVSRDELERHLAEVRERGYAVSHAENEPDVSSLGVPVRDSDNVAVACIVVTAPTSRVQEEWESEIRVAALDTARQLGQELARRDG
jgi:IclR family transcriptional regulator, acetate operon repressor